MGIVFKAQHPIFGRANKPLSLAYQQRSPYYWWWAFLRRNEDYKACCDAGGEGKLAALYADFRDVFASDDFKPWWDKHGYYLFAERDRTPVKLAELSSRDEWDSEWLPTNVMVVSVPLNIPKRRLQGFFSELVQKRHPGKRGRKALSDSDASTARYPLYRNVSVPTLQTQLAVYDLVTAKKRGEVKKTLAKIGAELRLVRSAIPNTRDDPQTAEHKRNVMAATVSRHYKEAKLIVENTALGLFPKSK